MMTDEKWPSGVIDKDSIIRDLQLKLKEKDEEISELLHRKERALETTRENIELSNKYQKLADDAKRERDKAQAELVTARNACERAELDLAFAEGFIAAFPDVAATVYKRRPVTIIEETF